MTKYFANEREAWEDVRGPHNAKKRRNIHRLFKKLFEKGHEESLRPMMEIFSIPENQYYKPDTLAWTLQSFHPRAFEFLAQYGQDYRPLHWHKPPKWGEPKPALCFGNSWVQMESHNAFVARQPKKSEWHTKPPMVYVEGVAFGCMVTPMLHAWNSLGLESKFAKDWSHYAMCDWTRYFGIPFTSEEYHKALGLVYRENPKVLLLFKTDNFPRVESYLKDLMQERIEKKSQTAK